MNLTELKSSFFKYLNQLEESELQMLMNYLSLLANYFDNNYSKFRGK